MSVSREEPIIERRQRLISEAYLKDEGALVAQLRASVGFSAAERSKIAAEAADLVRNVRSDKSSVTIFDKLLQEYGLSSHEGVQLMRLAEALIRTPDYTTRRLLIRDKIGNADWASHKGHSESALVNLATNGMRLSRGWIKATGGTNADGIMSAAGDRILDGVMGHVMKALGRHFVLGRDIHEALRRSSTSKGEAFSFDMLGEAARTDADAQKYFDDYLHALNALAKGPLETDISRRPGLSVKLSALHPRFEYAKREDCLPVIIERMKILCTIAADADLWLNIDAEECDRTELTLDVFAALLEEPRLSEWGGLGLVVQAYQRRAMPVIDFVMHLARQARRKVAVRLVKGAYWDSEIKRAQELGLPDYPVFTRKENTDVSYIACAQRLLDASEHVFPQFATHNAHTAVSVAQLAGGRPFEFQRLHGMGAGLHTLLSEKYGVISRVYAPVGQHRELLPYLVRRLLENGANSSFVNQMYDADIDPSQVASDSFDLVQRNVFASHPAIPSPCKILGDERDMAAGHDLTQQCTAKQFENIVSEPINYSATSIINGFDIGLWAGDIFSPQKYQKKIGSISCIGAEDIHNAVSSAKNSHWMSQTSPEERARILSDAADLIEEETSDLVRLCVWEAGKTLPDAVSEIREAVDFCRYYAAQAQRRDIVSREPLGVVACISPWNFPLAIFLGQVSAALSVGNPVVAKPPHQTPLIAHKAVTLLHRAGVPSDALHLVLGDGAELGNALVRDTDVAGVCFTGSTATAQIIARNLADTDRFSIPLIAETGGINAMIVDSTSLLEQAVQDAISSAFQSAGQRCSACRIVAVQSDIAEAFTSMLIGAMDKLTVGDAEKLSTDVGPIIDKASKQKIESYIDAHRAKGRVIAECELPKLEGYFVPPCLIAVDAVGDVKEEIFGPVLHLVTFKVGERSKLIDEINRLGFGLTLGVHTRIDAFVDQVSERANIGNIYVNRNQIGAVVGVQPFGGEGLSGTGPKAGGPNYLLRLSRPPTERATASVEAAASSVETSGGVNGDLDIERVRQAQKSIRHESLRKFKSGLDAEFGAQTVNAWLGAFDYAPERWLAPRILPGPTGELNTLRRSPRGVLLVLGAGEDKAFMQQVVKCIVTGNACIIVDEGQPNEAVSKVRRIMKQSGLPDASLTTVSRGHFEALIYSEIEGIVLEDAKLELYQRVIADRSGPLLPILSSKSELSRFFVERTLTVNTAAAGGNASLFAALS